ncbi:hypothetical protein CRM22_005630 [Opisthorchis felineus]|uniref:Protein kinase domain-containing protein n=1 Tax=Opisthorchis felineus TaxID=147828 RepID=A0A4S2LQB3_OPIFE|nr:hypothetical protein CRM22_005630 [Opisthorchis felineus]
MITFRQQSPSSLGVVRQSELSASCRDSFSDEYDLLSEIGRGRFARVCQVRHKRSGETFAAKIIRRWRNGKDTIETLMRELDIIERGKLSRRIVSMNEYYVRATDFVIILEHACGGDLYSMTHYFEINPSVAFVKSAVQQSLEALDFLHERSIVHLDVKPDNILLRQPYPDCDIILCDFGLSKFLSQEKVTRDLVGTPDYAAPEILDYNPIHLTTDIWSIGVLTYYLLTGTSPFWAPTKEQTCANVSQLLLSFPDDLFLDIPQAAVRFIQRILVKNPNDRPSASQCLLDPWFSDIEEEEQPEPPVPTCATDCVTQAADDTKDSPITYEPVCSELDRSYGEC